MSKKILKYTQWGTDVYRRFFNYTKKEQAGLIWEYLFIRQSPLSEACRGVLSSLNQLHLGEHVGTRNLEAMQYWFEKQSLESHLENVFKLANVRYAVMTNNPFNAEETEHWVEEIGRLKNNPIPDRLKTALRIDSSKTLLDSTQYVCCYVRSNECHPLYFSLKVQVGSN